MNGRPVWPRHYNRGEERPLTTLSVKLLLFAIVVLLFDIALAMESSGLGTVVFLIAVAGLVLGAFGLARRDA